MKIYVSEVNNGKVFFLSDFGNGIGIWKSDGTLCAGEYNVEFDIDEIFTYSDFAISKEKRCYISVYNNENLLTLLLLEYGEFGDATFRLGDSIIVIQTDFDERFLLLKNSYVTVQVGMINIYDENL